MSDDTTHFNRQRRRLGIGVGLGFATASSFAAQARQAELAKEYNNGEPDKIGGEARNYQKYLDRVAELKASIARNQADIEGIQRELKRYGP